jgi:hypothetical protein
MPRAGDGASAQRGATQPLIVGGERGSDGGHSTEPAPSPPTGLHFVNSRGSGICYRYSAAGSQPRGVVFFCHGIGSHCNGCDSTAFAERLAGAGLSCFMLDLEGSVQPQHAAAMLHWLSWLGAQGRLMMTRAGWLRIPL